MVKKNLLVVVYVAFLAFIAVATFYKIQERDLVIQLNNHNLSAAAYKVKVKSSQSLAQLNEAVSKSKLTNLQLHYQAKADSQVTYFYGKGKFATPPMITGNFFSEDDFKSDVAVAVVGKDWQKKLYKPQGQAYIKLNGTYIPVIGIMGDSYKSDLDKQIFIAQSQQQTPLMKAADYKLVVDAKQALTKKDLRTVFKQAKITPLVTNVFIVPQSTWVAEHLRELAVLALVVIGLALELGLWVASFRRKYQAAKFAKLSLKKYAFEEWEFYTLFTGLGLAFGTVLGILRYSFTSVTAPILYALGIYFVASLGCYILLKKKMSEFERNEKR